MNRTPSQGINILENLYKKHPNHQGIINNLINAYIKFGNHDLALKMIATIPEKKTDVQSLKFKAWACNKKDNRVIEHKNWEAIFNKTYYDATHGILGDLLYRGTKKIVLNKEDIPVFCVERNEMLRLPFFLKHYRELGVTHFFFIDNNSDDGSLEFLMQQPDCYVFWTNSSHQQAGSGMVWIQFLIEKFLRNEQWYLIIDADEFLIYPNCESRNLNILTHYLDSFGFTAIHSFVLDMFPKNLKQQLEIDPLQNLIKQAPYFYNNYEFYYQVEPPYIDVRGGIFYVLDHLKRLNVVPLFKKTDPSTLLLYSRHSTTPTRLPQLSSCLLHFKFLGDFANHALNEMKRKEHWNGGREYRQYFQMFEQDIDENFKFSDLSKTVKYQNSQQLVELGLIQTSDEWEKFVHMEDNNNE